jgi:hypothetical protein
MCIYDYSSIVLCNTYIAGKTSISNPCPYPYSNPSEWSIVYVLHTLLYYTNYWDANAISTSNADITSDIISVTAVKT